MTQGMKCENCGEKSDAEYFFDDFDDDDNPMFNCPKCGSTNIEETSGPSDWKRRTITIKGGGEE